MQKSPDAFRTISEVAAELDLPQHVLRFWETRFTTIRPLKRGGGRRYYRPDDLDLLKGIRQLLYGQGYTIKGVQRILKEDGVRFVQALGRGERQAPAYPAGNPDEIAADGDEVDETFGSEAGWQDQAPPDDTTARGSEPPHGAMRARALEPNGNGVTPDQLDRLASVLDELLECERILDSLADHEPAGTPETGPTR